MTSPHSPIPAGALVTVPREPTPEMIEAGTRAGVAAAPEPWCPAAWRAMLVASPAHATGAAMRERLEAAIEEERKAIYSLLEKRARYFESATSYRTWEDAARSYRATMHEIANDAIKRDCAALSSPAPEGEAAVTIPYDDFFAAYRHVPRSKMFPDDCLKTRLRALLNEEDLAHADEAEALAAPEGEAAQGVEPVAWRAKTPFGWATTNQEGDSKYWAEKGWVVEPLFAAPPSVKQEEDGRS